MEAPATRSAADRAVTDLRDRRRREQRDRLVDDHIGLAHAMAARYRRRGIPREDLEQTAVVGLLKAADRFDPHRGCSFSSFAVPTILGELRRAFRDTGWMVKVPRRLQELRMRADSRRRRLEQQLGRPATVEEVAASLGEPVEAVRTALEGLRSCYRPDALDGVDLDRHTDAATSWEDALLVGELLAELPEREQRIVVLRFWAGWTQQEIADDVGVSQMHVSRLLRASLVHLHELAVADTAIAS